MTPRINSMRRQGSGVRGQGSGTASSGLVSIACLVLIGLCAAGASGAAARKPPELPSAKVLLAEPAAQLEREIAQLMLKRPYASAAESAGLEMQIDLRVLGRWVLQQGLAAKPESDLQIACCLRAAVMLSLISDVEEAMGKEAGRGLSKAQTEAMGQLHQITFGLGDLKDVKELDGLTQKLAVILLNLVGPQAVNLRTVPPMRPSPLPRGEAPVPQAAGGEPRTVAQLAEEARRANVSAPLRQQILALAAVASGTDQPLGPPPGEKDVAAMRQVLELAVDLSRGLATNTAVSPEARVQIEQQLTEGLALFADPRTRPAGQKRLEGLDRYRQIVARIGRMNLTAEQARQFAPLFVWAEQHAEQGARVLGAVELFLQYQARHDARPKTPNSIQNLRRPGEDLEKVFQQASSAFQSGAAEMANLASTVTAADLEARAADLRRTEEVLEKLDAMPRTLDTLAAYKPKLFANMERRVTAAAAAAAQPAASVSRTEATTFLIDLHQLAQAAEELAQISIDDIPPAVQTAYAGGHLSALDAKWRSIVSETASAGAGGAEIDRAKLARLAYARELLLAMREAPAIEGSLEACGGLTRWVDWQVSPAYLRSVLSPYPQALAAAVGGFVNDAAPSAAWPKVQRRHRPVIALLYRLAPYRDACAALPGGLGGSVASLATPLADGTFALERYATVAMQVWARCAQGGDGAGAQDALAVLTLRLARAQGLEWKDEDTDAFAAPALRVNGRPAPAAPATPGGTRPASGKSIFD